MGIEKESRVKDGNYIVIQSFMVKVLKLKGNELLIYALIQKFSKFIIAKSLCQLNGEVRHRLFLNE